MAKNARRGTRLIEALPEDGLRRLMLGVLMDAIRVLRGRPTDGVSLVSRRAWVRERQWMESGELVYPFAFIPICNALGIEPGYVRRVVLGDPAVGQTIAVRRYPSAVEDSWRRLSGARTAHAGRRTVVRRCRASDNAGRPPAAPPHWASLPGAAGAADPGVHTAAN